jgi:hypothetical protein
MSNYNRKLPEIRIVDNFDSLHDGDLINITLFIMIMTSGQWSYSYHRGKYGKLTDHVSEITYRIEQKVFEKLYASINILDGHPQVADHIMDMKYIDM